MRRAVLQNPFDADGTGGVGRIFRVQGGYLVDMVWYRRGWGCVCGLLVALGVVAALLAVPVGALVPLFVLPGVLGLMFAMVTLPGGADVRVRDQMWRVVTVALMVGAISVAVAGLLALIGPSALLIGVLAVAGSPIVVRRFFPKAEKHDELRELSTLMLCRQWQRSYDELRAETALPRRLEIVQERARCLDELERRDPTGLQAWLASNASAAGDPARFLSEPPTPS